jgi:hypothetical protein
MADPPGKEVSDLQDLDSIASFSKRAEPWLPTSGGERHLVAERCESAPERMRSLEASSQSGEIVGQEEDSHGGSRRKLSA